MSAVRIELMVGGVADVRNAFKSVEQEMVRIQKQTTRASQSGAKERASVAKTEAKDQSNAWKATAKEAAAFEKQKLRIRENSATYAGKLAAKQVAEETKAAKASVREQERKWQQVVRFAEKGERENTRIAEREAQNRARIVARESKQEAASRQHFRQAVTGNFAGSVKGAIGVASGLAAGALTFGGAVTAGDAIRGRMKEESSAVALANAAFQPEVRDSSGKIVQEARGRPDIKEIQGTARGVQAKTGIATSDLQDSWRKYVEISSDYQGGKDNLEGFAKLAKGTGSDLGEVMGAAGTLKAQNKDMTSTQMMDVMRNVIGQGQFGDISMRDMAVNAGTITAGAAAYGGDQKMNQGRLLGLTQIAGRAADPAEAATAVARFGDDVLKHRDTLNAAGVKVSDAKGKLLDPAEILKNMFAKTGGDLGKMADLGLGERSIKVAKALSGTYESAEAQKKGSGAAAVMRDVSQVENASYSQKDVDASFAAVMNTSAEKFDLAVMMVKESLATKLQPALDGFIGKLPELEADAEKFINALSEMASFMTSHPFASLAAGLSTAFLAEVGNAKLADVIEKGIAGKMGGGMGALTIAAAAATITVAGIAAIDHAMDGKAKDDSDAAAGSAGAVSKLAALKRLGKDGKVDPDAVKAAQGEIDRLTNRNEVLKKGPGGVEAALGMATSLVDGGESSRTMATARSKELKENEDSLTAFTAAVKAATAAMGPAGVANPKDPSRNGPMSGGPRGGAT